MRWDLKIIPPTPQVLDQIKTTDYPHDWTLDQLERHAFLLKAVTTKDRELVGYFWFSLVPDTYKMYELHMAVLPKFHSRWFDRRSILKLSQMASLIDADTVLFFHPQNPRRLEQLKRLGFEVFPPFALYHVGEKNGEHR